MTRKNRRPNVLFLMTDQQRWNALGCVNPAVQTPNLDALAARGTRYSEAVCNAPICVPSRYSMMTGLYGSQVGSRHNGQFCDTDDDLPMPVLPQRLHDAGYQTVGIGKTHWRSYFSSAGPEGSSRRGFEIRALARWGDERSPGALEVGARYQGQDEPEWFEKLQQETAPFGIGGEATEGYAGLTSAIPGDHHREGWLTRQALRFLDHERDGERPWFLYVSFDFPHAAYNVPQGYETRYDIEEIDVPELPTTVLGGHGQQRWEGRWPRLDAYAQRLSALRYYAICTFIDELFGRILNKVDEIGELDNTYVVFLADHGEMLGDRGRVSKYCLYEGSVRVPIILAGPSLPQGVIDDRPAELVDVLPTILELVGLETPPVLSGGSLLAPPVRTGQFCELHGTQGGIESAPAYMWRRNGWKLIQYLPGCVHDASLRVTETEGELYELRADPLEMHNLYDDPEHFALRGQMTRELLMHLAVAWTKYPWQFAPRAKLRPDRD